MRNLIAGTIAASVLMTACATSGKSKNEKNNPEFPSFSAEAHRGGRGLMPENTIPAMVHSLGLPKVTTLEMDVVISKDRKVVVSHDNYLNAIFCLSPEGKEMTKEDGQSRIIFQMSYDSVAKYDAGMKVNPGFPRQKKMAVHKPLLADLLEVTESYTRKNGMPPKWYNIETKTQNGAKGDGIYQPSPEEFVDLLVEQLRKAGIEKRTVIQSFDFRTLQVVHKKYPEIKTSMLIPAKDKRSLDEQVKALGFTPFIYSPEYTIVTPELVKACHNKGMKVVPWTVNTAEELEQVKATGVDGIISDYPDLF